MIRDRDASGLTAHVGANWVTEFYNRFKVLKTFHALEVVAKPDRPVIKVLTKGGAPQRELSVTQLSDGQKHTILLTIAMLAESNLPLVIDQPEDDLDNAFIFSSVVRTLRSIKERRQVVLVTHNANIAVLGDSELILPLKMSDNKGQVLERGSIDRLETRKTVQDILEGGELAFRRRKEIYGY
jgi:ABC-type cobalamin/Fe3+-siderophores transport system ATPase subunit